MIYRAEICHSYIGCTARPADTYTVCAVIAGSDGCKGTCGCLCVVFVEIRLHIERCGFQSHVFNKCFLLCAVDCNGYICHDAYCACAERRCLDFCCCVRIAVRCHIDIACSDYLAVSGDSGVSFCAVVSDRRVHTAVEPAGLYTTRCRCDYRICVGNVLVIKLQAVDIPCAVRRGFHVKRTFREGEAHKDTDCNNACTDIVDCYICGRFSAARNCHILCCQIFHGQLRTVFTIRNCCARARIYRGKTGTRREQVRLGHHIAEFDCSGSIIRDKRIPGTGSVCCVLCGNDIDVSGCDRAVQVDLRFLFVFIERNCKGNVYVEPPGCRAIQCRIGSAASVRPDIHFAGCCEVSALTCQKCLIGSLVQCESHIDIDCHTA